MMRALHLFSFYSHEELEKESMQTIFTKLINILIISKRLCHSINQ